MALFKTTTTVFVTRQVNVSVDINAFNLYIRKHTQIWVITNIYTLNVAKDMFFV